jgi:hypothetical protein
MSAYLNHHSGQLFDVVPDVLNTVGQTASDIERLYNQFSGSGSDGAVIAPDQYPLSTDPSGSNIPPDSYSGAAEKGTDYTPYFIGAGVVAVAAVALWLVLKK